MSPKQTTYSEFSNSSPTTFVSHNMADVSDNNCQLFVFWGGEICQYSTPPQLYYTLPPQLVITIHVNSGLPYVVNLIRNAMGITSDCIIQITARLLIDSPMGVMQMAYRIVNATEWEYFVFQTKNLGELHIYVTPELHNPSPSQNTFTALLAGNESSSADFGAYEPYVDFFRHDNPLESLTINTEQPSRRTFLPETSEQIGSSDSSSSEELVSGTSDSSEEGGTTHENLDQFTFPFDSIQQVRQEDAQPSRGNRVADSEIPYFHAPVSFNTGFEEEDDDTMPSYDPESGVLHIGMVFPCFDELHQAVTIYHIRQRKEFRSSYKKSTSWRAVCANFMSKENPCYWMLSASKLKGPTGEWQIKKLTNTHVCRHDFNDGGVDKMCRSKLIATLVTHKIRDDPHYKVKHIQSDVKNEYGLDVTYRKAWYARKKCIEQEYDKFGDS